MRLLPLGIVLPAMVVHHLLLVITDHLMAAGFLPERAPGCSAFLAMVFGSACSPAGCRDSTWHGRAVRRWSQRCGR
jgi:hypothetical protein